MAKMTEKQHARWAITRQRGRFRFILILGVLIWGIGTAVLFSIFMAAQRGFDHFVWDLGLALILFPIGGYFWGSWMWRFNERQFAESRQDRGAS